MPAPNSRPKPPPSYCRDKATDRAFVRFHGRRTYLGKYDSPESRAMYDRLVMEWIAGGRTPAAAPTAVDDRKKVNDLVLGYWRHAKTYYASSTGELGATKSALHQLRRLYGPTPAAEFGPVALKAVREAMVAAGWCRSYVNAQVGRLVRAFRWGVENEIVGAAVWQALEAVAPLRAGKTPARESPPVRPANPMHVAATLPHLSGPVRAMVELQQHTGMRPGEVCAMRGKDVDTSDPSVWVYRPPQHKTAYKGEVREVFLNAAARRVLKPFLKPDLAVHLFSPAEAEAARLAARSAARTTPAAYGNVPGSRAAARGGRPRGRPPGDRYDRDGYRRAVERACDAAFPPPDPLPRAVRLLGRWKRSPRRKGRPLPKALAAVAAAVKKWRREHRWHPHQLRHAFATEVRRRHGLEAAQVLLGHAHADVTQIYASRNRELAVRVVSEMG